MRLYLTTTLNLVQVIFMQSGLCSQLQWSKANYTWIPIKKNYNSHDIFHVFTFKQYEQSHSDLENIKSGIHLLK